MSDDCGHDHNIAERVVWRLFWVGQKLAWFRFHRRHRSFRPRRVVWWLDDLLDRAYDLYDEARDTVQDLWREERHLLARWRLFEAARYAVFNGRYVLRERPFRAQGGDLCPQHSAVARREPSGPPEHYRDQIHYYEQAQPVQVGVDRHGDPAFLMIRDDAAEVFGTPAAGKGDALHALIELLSVHVNFGDLGRRSVELWGTDPEDR